MSQRHHKNDSDSDDDRPGSYVARGPRKPTVHQSNPQALSHQKGAQIQQPIPTQSYAGDPPYPSNVPKAPFIHPTQPQMQGHGFNPNNQPGYGGYGVAAASGNPSVYANNPIGFQPGPAINPINQPGYTGYRAAPSGSSSANANNPTSNTQVPAINPSNQPGYGGYGTAPLENPPAYPNQQASHSTAYQQGQSYPANVPAPNTGYSPYQPPRPAPRGGQGQPRDNSQRY